MIVFDFDGTVALGYGPVRAYARAVARGLPADAAEQMLTALDVAIELELATVGSTGTGIVVDDLTTEAAPLDGYDLVGQLARFAGASPGQLEAGYLASREHLGTDSAPVTAPHGLADFLCSVASAHRVLVTNAPAIRVQATLDGLGFQGGFDRVITSAQKPDGFAKILDELSPEGNALLSIGDIWHNDLAPAQERGHSTALVGRSRPASATPDFRAELLHELYPVLTSWFESALAGDRASTATPQSTP